MSEIQSFSRALVFARLFGRLGYARVVRGEIAEDDEADTIFALRECM